jgi:hypothetical protein
MADFGVLFLVLAQSMNRSTTLKSVNILIETDVFNVQLTGRTVVDMSIAHEPLYGAFNAHSWHVSEFEFGYGEASTLLSTIVTRRCSVIANLLFR